MAARYGDNHQDAQLIATFTDRIDQSVGEWHGRSSSLVTRTPEIRCYTNSFLLRYEVATSTGPKAVLLKIRRKPKMDSLAQAIQARELHTNIEDEYNSLRYVFERIGSRHEHFTAIRPLAYFEEYFAIVMEELPSRSLRQLLHRHRGGINLGSNSIDLKLIAQRAGELLHFFHERVHSTETCLYSVADILADVEPYVVRLQRDTRGHIQAQSILDAFAERLSTRDIQSIPYTKAHQDLTCDNVLYSNDGRVCLIDIKTKPAPIYSDLALLLIHPETFRNQIFRGGNYFSEQFIKGYQDSILKGYFAESPVDRFLVSIYCAIRILDKWSMHQELFHRYKGLKRVLTRPLSPLVTSYFQRRLNHYLHLAI